MNGRGIFAWAFPLDRAFLHFPQDPRLLLVSAFTHNQQIFVVHSTAQCQ